jgi:PII-like signaling protein
MIEIKIFFDEDDRHGDQPTYDYLMHYLLHQHIQGATLFSALMGYGQKHHLHSPTRIGASDERPLMIMFIEEREKALSVLPHIKDVVKQGLIIMNEVQIYNDTLKKM